MDDIETRLASLGALLDEAAPEIDRAEIERALRIVPAVAHRRYRLLHPVWIAAGSAAATLVLIGGITLLVGNRSDVVPGDRSLETSTLVTMSSESPITPPSAPVTTLPVTTAAKPAAPGTLPEGAVATANGWTRWLTEPGVFDDAAVLDIVDTGELLVAVGLTCAGNDCRGAVWASLDGIDWTSVDLPGEIQGSESLRAASVGKSGIVAVGSVWNGSETALAWHSEDGLEWTRSELPGGLDAGAGDVVATETGYLAVGRATRWEGGSGYDDGALWTSEDGITWERYIDEGGVFLNAPLDSVVADEGGFVAVGTVASPEPDQDGDIVLECCFAVWTSTTGTAWTLDYVDAVPSFLPPGPVDLAAGGPGYVAARETGIWYSPNGQDWSRTDPQLRGAYSAAWAGDRWVVGLDPQSTKDGTAIWESVDGRTWTPVAPPDSGLFDPDYTLLTTVRRGGPGLIAFGIVRPDVLSQDADQGLWTWTPLSESR